MAWSITRTPLTRADSTACGECISGSIARRKAATNTVRGGSVTTNIKRRRGESNVSRMHRIDGVVYRQRDFGRRVRPSRPKNTQTDDRFPASGNNVKAKVGGG